MLVRPSMSGNCPIEEITTASRNLFRFDRGGPLRPVYLLDQPTLTLPLQYTNRAPICFTNLMTYFWKCPKQPASVNRLPLELLELLDLPRLDRQHSQT